MKEKNEVRMVSTEYPSSYFYVMRAFNVPVNRNIFIVAKQLFGISLHALI
jgi:hypothetical protein